MARSKQDEPPRRSNRHGRLASNDLCAKGMVVNQRRDVRQAMKLLKNLSIIRRSEPMAVDARRIPKYRTVELTRSSEQQ